MNESALMQFSLPVTRQKLPLLHTSNRHQVYYMQRSAVAQFSNCNSCTFRMQLKTFIRLELGRRDRSSGSNGGRMERAKWNHVTEKGGGEGGAR